LSELERIAKERLSTTAKLAADLAGGEAPELVARAAQRLAGTLRGGGTVLFCGNGGSAADAQHLATELVGRMSNDREPLRGVALTTDTSALTAIANDYGFEEVFARQVRGIARPGDALVALSTSGRSQNVVRAARTAKAMGLTVIALTGPQQGPLEEEADVVIRAPGATSAEIQQGHIALGHLICELVESNAR